MQNNRFFLPYSVAKRATITQKTTVGLSHTISFWPGVRIMSLKHFKFDTLNALFSRVSECQNLLILKTKTPLLCLQQLWHGAETIKLPKLSAVCDLASWNLCLAEISGFYRSPISSFQKRFRSLLFAPISRHTLNFSLAISTSSVFSWEYCF